MFFFSFCAEGPKGLVGLRWREGMAERFGVDRTKAMGDKRKKGQHVWQRRDGTERSVSYLLGRGI